jgi:hypothetical protein
MEHPHPGTLDHVYAAPADPADAFAAELRAAATKAAADLRKRAAKLLVASVVGFALTLSLAFATRSPLPLLLLLGAALVALAGAGHAVAALIKGAGAAPGAKGIASAVALTFGNLFMAALGVVGALVSTMAFTRGRQIRSFGKILLPPVEPGDAWTGAGLSSSGPVGVIETEDEALRHVIAAQWRENGRTEHASVAAFARLTLDLMALGAPPELVADSNRDALDEIRHTELCFGLARAIDGRVESPGAFPEAARARTLSRSRSIALAQLAVDSLVDGALHEGVSARIIAKLARRCEAPAIQCILKEIAADEGRHARHGWDVVRWCLSEGGEPVASALQGALRALPKHMSSPMPAEARDGSWERWGIMGEELEAEEHDATRADLERRLGQAIAASRSSRQPDFGYGNVSVG